MLALLTLLVDLALLCADERAFVDVGVDLDVGIIADFESVLFEAVSLVSTSSLLDFFDGPTADTRMPFTVWRQSGSHCSSS